MKAGIAKLVDEIREHKRCCAIANCTFSPIPRQYREQMEEHIQKDFDLWWESWIAPKLNAIHQKASRKKRALDGAK